ncbi:ABC transporter permease [Phytoactinopolyspora halotolerans]|uniref:ABC transporter permease n=1 Tax=Phytoactinopolyspora halotolerans TaxID=1981512 RepID=A0A6L9S9B2_9ACTN|nr:ABC transporter permease [Phytoactinopolyspora halotolerans]NEE01623.1 ABC transporter permease [Phytoactinopolyspora halotolerans]
MTLFVARRLGAMVLTVVLASLLVFVALQALPGDVATQILGRDATPEAVQVLRDQLGLDQPAWRRYLEWVGGAIQGDFGTSLASGEAVGSELALHLRNTLLIAVLAIAGGLLFSLVLGVVAGLYRDRWPDHLISGASLVGMSVPEFVVATVLVLLFSVTIPVFPAVVLDDADATVGQLLPAIWLPALALSIALAAYVVRMMRASVIDVMASEYVQTARLRGLGTGRVVLRHALPNAVLPTLNVIALNVAWLVGGVVVVETVFNYPGIGTLMIDAVYDRDLPVLQAIAVLSAVVYALCNLAADVAAMGLNPRLRAGGRSTA